MSCVKSTLANHFIALISIFIIIDFLHQRSLRSNLWNLIQFSQLLGGLGIFARPNDVWKKSSQHIFHSVYTSAIGKREVSKICRNCWRIVLKNMGEGKGGVDKNPENSWGRLWMVSNANSHKIYYSFPATNNPIYITMYLLNSIK